MSQSYKLLKMLNSKTLKLLFGLIMLSFIPYITAYFLYDLLDSPYIKYYSRTISIVMIIFWLVYLLYLIIAFSRIEQSNKKFTILLATYVGLWLSFGNYYYFLTVITDMQRAYEIHLNQAVILNEMQLKYPGEEIKYIQLSDINRAYAIEGMADSWKVKVVHENNEISSQELYKPINRLDIYYDCLYFSAITISTTGYGDFVPKTGITKLYSVLEAFSGQLILVFAVGIWLSRGEKKHN